MNRKQGEPSQWTDNGECLKTTVLPMLNPRTGNDSSYVRSVYIQKKKGRRPGEDAAR